MTGGNDYFPHDMVEIGLHVNQAMLDKDGNRLVRAVVSFLKHYNIKVDAGTAAQIPVKNRLRVISPRDQ